MQNSQINDKDFQKTLLEFTEYLARYTKPAEELNTAEMSGDNDSDEAITASVKEYLARTARQGVKR